MVSMEHNCVAIRYINYNVILHTFFSFTRRGRALVGSSSKSGRGIPERFIVPSMQPYQYYFSRLYLDSAIVNMGQYGHGT